MIPAQGFDSGMAECAAGAAGESQARNRYTFAASQARASNLAAIAAVFTFTAEQEKEHAQIFYGLLRACSGENIRIDGAYPVDLSDSVTQLLRFAQHNEAEEYDPVYRVFGKTAKEEGFLRAAAAFGGIAAIEKTHSQRFGMLAELMENGRLFVSEVECGWMCLNCGHIYTGTTVPPQCPVCAHDRGYFIRLEMAPFVSKDSAALHHSFV